MNNDIFSGLEDLGFDNIEDVDIFDKDSSKEENPNAQKNELSEEEKVKAALYDKEVTCPVCGNVFKAKSVKSSSLRVLKKDSDFFIRYQDVNPYFYDVWICNVCGYANVKADFLKIKEFQKELVGKNITPKWHGKSYPDVYDVNIAIERLKLSLLNSCVYGADSSKKAMNCLKIAWMYRLLEDSKSEITFIKQAIEGFNDAYMNERFPIYGMSEGTMMYLLGELHRRCGDYDESLNWFSKVLTTTGMDQKLKDMARDQKDLIKEDISQNEADEPVVEETPKKGFFSRFFK